MYVATPDGNRVPTTMSVQRPSQSLFDARTLVQ